MTAGLVINLENVRSELKKAETEAARLKVDADKVKSEVLESGVNPFGTSTEAKAAFDKIDAAYKPADEKREEASQLQAQLNRLTEVEGIGSAAGARRPFGGESREDGAVRRMTAGRRFTESEQYKALEARGLARWGETEFSSEMQRGFGSVDILSRDELEAVLASWPLVPGATTVTGGGSTSAGPFIQNDLVPGFVSYRRKRALLSAMVGPGTTDSDVVEYVNQTAPTDASAETAEDTAAPESVYAFETKTANVREITHFVPVTLRAMADHGQIRTIVENELALGALDRLDTQLASGDGAGQNLTGIYNASGIGTQALGGLSRSEALHKAITKIRIAAGVLSEPDAIGIHPSDFEDLILEQDANGQYIFGPPNSGEAKTAWGFPLVTSTVFTNGTPLAGDFFGSARLWLRESLAATSGLDGNDFTKRRVSLLAALRVAFAVTRPGGFCTVTGF